MRGILIVFTTIITLGIIASVGFFGYNKYQEVELEKHKLQVQQKELKEKEKNDEQEQSVNDNSGEINSEETQPVTQVSQNDNSSNETNKGPDFDSMSPQEIFNYHIKGMDQDNIAIEKGKFDLQKGSEYTDQWRQELKSQYGFN
ncbi:hypothetical protein [Staphylococcus debuckii]|uniref:hypothetical protein n=1 Tax=Staphylococcus debuckii TaxID=2044912 RepID=UPI000F437099|nr:hypothetical protein [Staphylococcus debuckii]AYU54123.1 hypothetical protein CNQ82_01180 [Staphylococcus debuckii]